MVSSYQIDLVTRFVPLSVFAEVARGVAGEIAGGMDEWCCVYMCVCVCVCGVHKTIFKGHKECFWEYSVYVDVCV